MTIQWMTDDLYRLTAADYSNGDYYHYTYDAVGNRLTQANMVNGLSSVVDYVYDDANRLTSVNGVTYTWDNNGNLLNDGVNTYTYNAANQLKTMTGPSVAASYAYNGMGDRLQEIVNGQTTNFMMDYNTGLTQVLNDGTNTYIYGNGRIAQVNTGTEYFLGDALGSVRQLTNNSGAVTYASMYDPYGVTTQASGASQTAYGFTGEYTSNDLVYLRARHYAPSMGRFLTRDTWGGNANLPMSYNKWAYVGGNPVNLTDPSGNFPPVWCQSMPNKFSYEVCVDLYYGIEPVSYFSIGQYVTGDQGCYEGPSRYRAPGYVEGTGITLAAPWIVNWMFTTESVYDFATMEHNYFENGAFGFPIPGVGISDFVWGVAITQYVGNVYGFHSPPDGSLNVDYSGLFITDYIGVSAALLGGGIEIGPSVGIGLTGFISPFDRMVRGVSVYTSASFGIDIFTGPEFGADAGFGMISTMPVKAASTSYKNRKPQLFLDILLGMHSGWIGDAFPRFPLPHPGNPGIYEAARVIAAARSLRYWAAYEELPHESK